MNVHATQEACPRCGLSRAEWTENGGDGVVRDDVTYCSEACANQDLRPDSIEPGGTRMTGGIDAGAGAGPENAGSPAETTSAPPNAMNVHLGGPRQEPDKEA